MVVWTTVNSSVTIVDSPFSLGFSILVVLVLVVVFLIISAGFLPVVDFIVVAVVLEMLVRDADEV